jgi:hypothetical protein
MATHTFTQYVSAPAFGTGGGGQVAYITEWTDTNMLVEVKYLIAGAEAYYDPTLGPVGGPYPVRVIGDGDSVTFTLVPDTAHFTTSITGGGLGVHPTVTILHTIPLPATLALFAIFLLALAARSLQRSHVQ